MFNGFRWYDWIIGYFTFGLWIFWKMHKNGAPIGKIIGGFIVAIVVLFGGLAIYSQTDSGMAHDLHAAYLKDNLSSAERILKENPNVTTKEGLTASEVVEKIKSNLKAEAERIAKEKAEAKKLAFAQSKGFDSYKAYKISEDKRLLAIAKKEKVEAEQLALAKSNGYNSYEEYRKGEAKKLLAKKEAILKALDTGFMNMDNKFIFLNGGSLANRMRMRHKVIIKDNIVRIRSTDSDKNDYEELSFENGTNITVDNTKVSKRGIKDKDNFTFLNNNVYVVTMKTNKNVQRDEYSSNYDNGVYHNGAEKKLKLYFISKKQYESFVNKLNELLSLKMKV